MTPRLEWSQLNIHFGKQLQTYDGLANYKDFFIKKNSACKEKSTEQKQVSISIFKVIGHHIPNLALSRSQMGCFLQFISMRNNFEPKKRENRLLQRKAGLGGNMPISSWFFVVGGSNPSNFNVEYPAFTKVNSEVFSTKNSYA